MFTPLSSRQRTSSVFQAFMEIFVERFSCVIGDTCEVVKMLQGDHCNMVTSRV